MKSTALPILIAVALIAATPTPTPSPPTSPRFSCLADPFVSQSDLGYFGCSDITPSPKPRPTLAPLPYVIVCRHDAQRCEVWKYVHGGYRLIQRTTPVPGYPK